MAPRFWCVTRGNERERDYQLYTAARKERGSVIQTDPTGVNFTHKEVHGVEGQSCTVG